MGVLNADALSDAKMARLREISAAAQSSWQDCLILSHASCRSQISAAFSLHFPVSRSPELSVSWPSGHELMTGRAFPYLEPPNQSYRWLGQVSEVVTGQPGKLEVGDLVQQAAVLGPERHKLREIEVDAPAVYEGRLGLTCFG